MAKQNVASAVEQAIEPTVVEQGCRLWDVRYEKEGAAMFLRVYIDSDEPVGVADCERVSRAIDGIIDELDPISESYYLEVCSAGLGRRLTRPRHFEQSIGREVRLVRIHKPQDGERELVGVLSAFNDGVITVSTPEGEQSVGQKELSYIKLRDDENLFSNNGELK